MAILKSDILKKEEKTTRLYGLLFIYLLALGLESFKIILTISNLMGKTESSKLITWPPARKKIQKQKWFV